MKLKKLKIKLLMLLLFAMPYICMGSHVTETNDITFSGSATLLNITISNEVINSAETDTDNIGMQSVTFPISNSQTGSVWMGYATLYDAPGAYNSALGNASLYHSTGSYNSAVGNVTLQSSPGSFNSALGYSALLQSPGDGNSAIGYTALRQAPGSYNLAGGYGAGYKSGGVSNVFLGANAAVNGTLTYYTNAIAIGAGAVPLGNNSMVLGNAQTTNTEIKGAVVVSNTLTAGAISTTGTVNIANLSASGRSVFGIGLSLADIDPTANGASQSGKSTGAGYSTIGTSAHGASQNIFNDGWPLSATIGASAYGAMQRGYIDDDSSSYATNLGRGAIQLFDILEITSGNPLTTVDDDASLLLGAGTASNRNAIVAGDGQESHGDGSITAGGGFWGNGSGLTNNYWSWWMLDPAPITTSVNGTNVYPIGLYDYDVAITNRSGGATSGTGVYDIVKWNPSNSVDFVGTLVYTGLVSTLGGVNAGLDVTLPKGSLYGIRLTNQTGLAGWHIQFKGVTK